MKPSSIKMVRMGVTHFYTYFKDTLPTKYAFNLKSFGDLRINKWVWLGADGCLREFLSSGTLIFVLLLSHTTIVLSYIEIVEDQA